MEGCTTASVKGGAARKVLWMNRTDFRYSQNGAVAVPAKIAKALGLQVEDRDWPVVLSLSKTHTQRRGSRTRTVERPCERLSHERGRRLAKPRA